MDKRGRVTIGEKLAKKYGRRFVVVPMPREILLVPWVKIKDPIAELARIGKEAGLEKYSMAQIKKMAENAANEEADRTIARLGLKKK